MEYIKVNDKYYFYKFVKTCNNGKKHYINTSMLSPHYRRLVYNKYGGLNFNINYDKFKDILYHELPNIKFDTIYESNKFDIICLVGNKSYDYYLENKDTISSISSLYLY